MFLQQTGHIAEQIKNRNQFLSTKQKVVLGSIFLPFVFYGTLHYTKLTAVVPLFIWYVQCLFS